VPLCRNHHRELHQAGNELAWWHNVHIKPLEIAKTLWDESRTMIVQVAAQAYGQPAPSEKSPDDPSQDAIKLPNEAN
jgi:hypothetical protein